MNLSRVANPRNLRVRVLEGDVGVHPRGGVGGRSRMEEDGEREVLGNQVRANVATVQLDYLSIGLVREQHLSHSRDEEWEDDSAEKQGGQRDSEDRPVARLPLPLFRIRVLLF